MRPPRTLRERAAANAQVARMNEIDRVVAHHLGGDSVEVVDVTEHHERADTDSFQVGFSLTLDTAPGCGTLVSSAPPGGFVTRRCHEQYRRAQRPNLRKLLRIRQSSIWTLGVAPSEKAVPGVRRYRSPVMSRRRPSRRAECPTPWKALFGTQSTAVARINEINDTAHHYTTTPQRAYACKCGYWHLTHKE